MFTVGACGLEAVAARRPGDAVWAAALSGVAAARAGQEVSLMPRLATLARYLPRLFRVRVAADGGVHGDALANRAGHGWSLRPCAVHLYTAQDVATCARLHLAATGAPLRLAFVGDSRVRNTLQVAVRASRDAVQFSVPGVGLDAAVSFLDSMAHHDQPLRAHGLELRLHWATFLHRPRLPEDQSLQGARDLLEAWAAGRAGPRAGDGPPPHVVYVSSGLWDTSMAGGGAEAVEGFVHTLGVVAPLLQALARRARVLWHVHGPIKPWLATRGAPNAELDMINRAAWARLGGGDVWLWDSRTVLGLRQHEECRALHAAGLHALAPRSWGCTNFQHAGRDVEHAAANMIWNLACNARMARPAHLCCAADPPPPPAEDV